MKPEVLLAREILSAASEQIGMELPTAAMFGLLVVVSEVISDQEILNECKGLIDDMSALLEDSSEEWVELLDTPKFD